MCSHVLATGFLEPWACDSTTAWLTTSLPPKCVLATGFDDLIVNIYPPYPDPAFTPNFTAWEDMFEHLRDLGYDWRDAWRWFSYTNNTREWFYTVSSLHLTPSKQMRKRIYSDSSYIATLMHCFDMSWLRQSILVAGNKHVEVLVIC